MGSCPRRLAHWFSECSVLATDRLFPFTSFRCCVCVCVCVDFVVITRLDQSYSESTRSSLFKHQQTLFFSYSYWCDLTRRLTLVEPVSRMWVPLAARSDCAKSGVYKTEVLVWRLVICGLSWMQMSAWRWGTRVWEVNDEWRWWKHGQTALKSTEIQIENRENRGFVHT